MNDFGYLAEGIAKKILNAGQPELPDFQEGCKVSFHFQTQMIGQDGEIEHILDDSKKAGKPMELIFGKQFKMPIWETCLKSMRIKEVAEFLVKKNLVEAYPLVSKSYREYAGIAKDEHKGHCCGMMALKDGPKDLVSLLMKPNDLVFKIELLKIEQPGEYVKESWTLDPNEKLKSIPELKESGNELYKNKEYDEAAKKYAEALTRLEQLLLREKPGEVEWLELEKIKIPILLNFSQCKLLEKDYYAVIEHTSTVLEKDPGNTKALYKRAKAYTGIWDLDLAREDFIKLGELDPSLQNIVQKELKKLNILQKEKDNEIKSRLAGKIFGDF